MNYIDKLPSDARRVKNTLNWVDRKGNVYGIVVKKNKHYGKYFKYCIYINKYNGYVYCPIKYCVDEKNQIYENRQRRVHIVIAETFIENPNNYPIVGHKNNIKNDNRVENLYWTTYQENTQKAVDDGLIINDKGYDDSQSHPVVMFETCTNKELGRFGSVKEANHETGISVNTIMRQCKYKRPVRKPWYFRFQDDKSLEPPTIVVEYNYFTDKELDRFFNIAEASRITKIPIQTIKQQCTNNKKPRTKTKSGMYFMYSN